MTYDQTDKKIIGALRAYSAGRLREYSQATGIPRSTLHERLRKLLSSGVRCVPVVDWTRLGYTISVIFFIPYQKEILGHPAINTCQHVSPNLLMLECVFSTMKEVEDFKEHLHAARYFSVIEALKREGFRPS